MRVSTFHSMHFWKRLLVRTYVYKIYEIAVLAIEHLRQRLAPRYPDLAPCIWFNLRLIIGIKENFPSARSRQHAAGRDALDLHHHGHVLFFVFTCEEWVTYIELVEDAAKRPHIDGGGVRDA